MKKVICILLSLVMILPLFCGCGKTYEEKKALAFEKAIKKNDQEAINEYVREYFELSDILSAEKILPDNAVTDFSYPSFEETLTRKNNASSEFLIVKVTATSKFIQDSGEYSHHDNKPYLASMISIQEILHDASGQPYINVNDEIPVFSGGAFIGINADGNYVLHDVSFQHTPLLIPGHEYIGILYCRKDADISQIHSGSFHAVDIEKEYEALQPYQNKLKDLTDGTFDMYDSLRRMSSLKFRQDMLEFCCVADKYPLPNNNSYSLYLKRIKTEQDSHYNMNFCIKMSDLISLLDGQEGTTFVSKSTNTSGYYWELACGQYAVIINSNLDINKPSSEYGDVEIFVRITDRIYIDN